jgi:hypothetical protein
MRQSFKDGLMHESGRKDESEMVTALDDEAIDAPARVHWRRSFLTSST